MRKRDLRELKQQEEQKDSQLVEDVEDIDYSRDIFYSIKTGFNLGILIFVAKSFTDMESMTPKGEQFILLLLLFLGIIYLIFREAYISYSEFGGIQSVRKIAYKRKRIQMYTIFNLIACLSAALLYFGIKFIFSQAMG